MDYKLREDRKLKFTETQKKDIEQYKKDIFGEQQPKYNQEAVTNVNAQSIRKNIEENAPEIEVNNVQDSIMQNEWAVDQKEIEDAKENYALDDMQRVAYEMAESKVAYGTKTNSSYEKLIEKCISYTKTLQNGYDTPKLAEKTLRAYCEAQKAVNTYLGAHKKSPWTKEGKRRVWLAKKFNELMPFSEADKKAILLTYAKKYYLNRDTATIENALFGKNAVTIPEEFNELKNQVINTVTSTMNAGKQAGFEDTAIDAPAYELVKADKQINTVIYSIYGKYAKERVSKDSPLQGLPELSRNSFVAFLKMVRVDANGEVVPEDRHIHEENKKLLDDWANSNPTEELFKAFDQLFLDSINVSYEYKGGKLEDYSFDDHFKLKWGNFKNGTIENVLSERKDPVAVAWREKRGITIDMLQFASNAFGKGMSTLETALKIEAYRHGMTKDFKPQSVEDYVDYQKNIEEEWDDFNDQGGLNGGFLEGEYREREKKAQKGDLASINAMNAFKGQKLNFTMTSFKNYYTENRSKVEVFGEKKS